MISSGASISAEHSNGDIIYIIYGLPFKIKNIPFKILQVELHAIPNGHVPTA